MADGKPTMKLDQADLLGPWNFVVAALERTGKDWATRALVAGICKLIRETVNEMRTSNDPNLVVRLRELSDALNHIPR